MTIKVTYKRLIDPKYIIGPINATSGRDIYKVKDPTLGTWNRILRTCGGTPHSPARVVVYRFYIEGIPSWIATHFVRHHIGVQFYIQSQREDKTNVSRAERKQTDPVNIIFDINANALINMAKARLCGKASKGTREVMLVIKEVLSKGDYYDEALSRFLMAPCGWYNTCFESQPCKKQYRGQ